MTIRVIIPADKLQAAETQLLPGIPCFVDGFGVVLDYIGEVVPEGALYACRLNEDGTFTVLVEAPAEFIAAQQFSGWPELGSK